VTSSNQPESTPEIGESVRITLAAETQGGQRTTTLEVPPDAVLLAVNVTDSGTDGETRGPKNASVRVFDPKGDKVEPTATGDPAGRSSFLLQSPMPGPWRIEVEYGGGASAEVSARFYKKGWFAKLRAGVGKLRCKTCKLVLSTLVVSTLIHMGPLIAAGTAPGAGAVSPALKPVVRQILTQPFTLSAGGVPKFLSILLKYLGAPFDKLMEQVCGWLRMCP